MTSIFKTFVFLGIIGSFVVSIILFVLLIVLGANIAAKNFLKISSFSNIVQKMDFQVIFVDENNKETQTGKRIYDYFSNMGISRKEVNTIIKNEKFKNLFGNYFGSILLKKIQKDTEIVYPTKEELYDFVNDNYTFFENVLKVEENDKNGIKTIIYREYDYVHHELEKISKEIIEESIDNEYLNFLLKPILTISLIGGIVVCIILLMIFRRSFYKWLLWFYVPTMTVALTFLSISFFANKIILSILTENIREYTGLISPFLRKLSDSLLTYGIVLFILTQNKHFVNKFGTQTLKFK